MGMGVIDASYVGGQGRPSDEVTSELTPDGSGTLGEESPTLPHTHIENGPFLFFV